MKKPPLPGDLIKKSNAIARARWTPESVWEPRIVALVASKVRKDDDDFYTYRIPIVELTGVDDKHLSGKEYAEIAKSIDRLAGTKIRIQGNKPKNFMTYTVFAKCGYEDGFLIAGFHPDLKPHFLNLKKQFVIYDLFEYLMLPTTYTQQLFELLKSWKDRADMVISVLDLHEILNTPASHRTDFWQFRTRVLEKAHKNINAKTKLKYDWEPIKKGRTVVEIRFIFSSAGEKKIKKTDARKEKQSQRNNEMMLKAYRCSDEKGGGICLKPTCGKKQAELCREYFQSKNTD